MRLKREIIFHTQPISNNNHGEPIMNKDAIIKKLEDSLGTFKEQLEKHDGSTLSAAATGAKAGFESARAGIESAVAGFEKLKDSVMESEKGKKALENMKDYLEKLEGAVKAGDKKLSAKAVEMFEKAVNDLKKKD
jgi:hypothetical protein